MFETLPATTIPIRDRVFICHLYSASQALEILLLLGEVAAGPLGRLLNRRVDADMVSVIRALDEVAEGDPSPLQILQLFGAVRRIGGVDLMVAILQTTYINDQQINSRKAFDVAFSGPGGLVDAALLLVKVLRYQFRPLWGALRPLLSEGQAGALGEILSKIQQRSAPTSTGGSGGQSSPDSEASEK